MTSAAERLALWLQEIEKVRNRTRRQGTPRAQSAADPNYGILP